jgi:hypothetical protein
MTAVVDRASGPKIDAGGRPRRVHEHCRKNFEKQSMLSMIRRLLLGIALASVCATTWAAEEVAIFEHCVDRRGNSVPVLPDAGQATLVRSAVEAGRTVIRYNSAVLSRLSASGHLFFYAHQCARLGFDEAGKSMASARTADCIGLNTLLDGGMLKYGDLPNLQAELSFSNAEWELLPGPPRNIDLSTCRPTGPGVLRLPPATPPSVRQTAWNDCLRACADRLWRCQKSCGNSECASCLATYGQCKAACGEAPETSPAR